MKIGLLSDTHSFLEPAILQYFADVDEIWHAGDVGDYDVIRQLERIKPVKAVFGNIDGPEIRNHFPEVLIMEIDGCKILMNHIVGPVSNYNKQTKDIIKSVSPNILICGHSHILKVVFDEKFNLLYINPGAAGQHGFHKERTALKFEINLGKPEKMFLLKLGPRGNK